MIMMRCGVALSCSTTLGMLLQRNSFFMLASSFGNVSLTNAASKLLLLSFAPGCVSTTNLKQPLAKTGVQGTMVQLSFWVFAVLEARRLTPFRLEPFDIHFMWPIAAIFNCSAFSCSLGNYEKQGSIAT